MFVGVGTYGPWTLVVCTQLQCQMSYSADLNMPASQHLSECNTLSEPNCKVQDMCYRVFGPLENCILLVRCIKHSVVIYDKTLPLN